MAISPGGAIYDNIMRAVSLTLLSDIKRRIFNEGMATDGGEIGQYSTKPIYVNPVNSPAAFGRPIGKTGSKFKTGTKKGQDHKTRYFPNGYKGFRDAIGRPTDKVNLSLSGQLNAQFVLLAESDGYYLGWPDDTHPKIANGLEVHFRKQIWALTAQELARFAELYLEQVHNALQ